MGYLHKFKVQRYYNDEHMLIKHKEGKEGPYSGEAWQAPPESSVKVNVIRYRRMETVSHLIDSMRKNQYYLCDIAIRGIAKM